MNFALYFFFFFSLIKIQIKFLFLVIKILGPDLLHEERRVLLKTQHLTRVGLLGAQDKVLGVLFNDLLLLVKEESANVGMKYKLYAKVFFFFPSTFFPLILITFLVSKNLANLFYAS